MKSRAREERQLTSARSDYEPFDTAASIPRLVFVLAPSWRRLIGFAMIWHIWWLVDGRDLRSPWPDLGIVFAWLDREGEAIVSPENAEKRLMTPVDLAQGLRLLGLDREVSVHVGGPHLLGHEGISISQRGQAPVRTVIAYGFWLFLVSDFILFAGLLMPRYAVLVACDGRRATCRRRTCSICATLVAWETTAFCCCPVLALPVWPAIATNLLERIGDSGCLIWSPQWLGCSAFCGSKWARPMSSSTCSANGNWTVVAARFCSAFFALVGLSWPACRRWASRGFD